MNFEAGGGRRALEVSWSCAGRSVENHARTASASRADCRRRRRREELSAVATKWYRRRYHALVAMTLRLDEQETEALRRRAELEGRSMQEVARQAVRDYIERTSKREVLDRVLDDELPRYAEALERLGQ